MPVASTGSRLHKKCPKLPRMRPSLCRNIAARQELDGIACRRRPPHASSKELTMRNRILAIAAIAAAIAAPVGAQAQSEITTGVARGGNVIVNADVDGIAVDQ